MDEYTELDQHDVAKIATILTQYATDTWNDITLLFKTNNEQSLYYTVLTTEPEKIETEFKLDPSDAQKINLILKLNWEENNKTWDTLKYTIYNSGEYSINFFKN